MGAGKTYLFEKIKGEDCFKNAWFIEEPSSKVKKYKYHKPLEEFYRNPCMNFGFTQLYTCEIYRKMFSESSYPCSDGLCISVRNMYSIQVFANVQYEMGYLKDFQYDYLTDIIQQNITDTLPQSCKLGCNRLVYIDTDVATCLKRIMDRKGQSNMENFEDYLNCLQQAYEDYCKIFSEENGRHYLVREKNSHAQLGVKTLLVNNNMPVCQD